MTAERQRVSIDIGKWQAVLGLLVLICTLGATVIAATSFAIRYQVGISVDAKTQESRATFTTKQDATNARELLDARLSVIEKRQQEIYDRIDYMWKRELERNGHAPRQPD